MNIDFTVKLFPITLFAGMIVAAAASAAGPLAAAGPGAKAAQPQPVLNVKPRYYRWHVDPGVEWSERNTGYATLDWQIPLSQAALVLVDVWDRHYLKEPEQRAEVIIQEKIRPLLKTCRQAGLPIIHAPSPRDAKKCPAWVGRQQEQAKQAGSQEQEKPPGSANPNNRAGSPQPKNPPAAGVGKPAGGPPDVWPPLEFRRKTGPYKKYARPIEPMAKDRARILKGICIHPDVRPEGSDVVVATGEELHRYCQQQGILFLIYLGFNTNVCVLERDYGTLAMHRRGYTITVLRDCTTGMESFQTIDDLAQTRGAIFLLEMNRGRYSLTSEELIAGLPK